MIYNRAFSCKKRNFVSGFLISQDKNFCQIATILILPKIVNLKYLANFDLKWKEVIQYNQTNKKVFIQKARKMTKQHENVTFGKIFFW